MADIILELGQSIPADTSFRYRDMGDGTHAPVVYDAAAGAAVENRIIVAESGGDYTTLEAAAAVAVAGDVVNVYPGTYSENNPLAFAANVTVKGIGESNITIIEAANTNQDLFTSADNLTIDGFTLSEVSGTGWIIQVAAAHHVGFPNCRILECVNGFRCNHASATLFIGEPVFETTGTTLVIGAQNNAGSLTIEGGYVHSGAVITTVFNADGANATTTINHFLSFVATVTTVINADNSARSVLTGCGMVGMYDGAVLAGGSDTRFIATNIFNAQQDSIRVDNSGSGTNFVGHALTIENAGRYDLNLLSATCTASGMGQLSPDKLNFVSGATMVGAIVNLKEDDEGIDIIGELHVGLPEFGSESVFGEGDSYTRGMLVYTYNPSGTVWADVSTEAASANGSTFTFPAVALNNAIYVASSLSNGDYLQHYGIKASLTTAVTLGGGAIVAEYWTGAAWVAIEHMSVKSGSPYTQYADHLFERAQSEQIRYPTAFLSAWTKNDPMTLGTDYFWIRYRVSSGVTTVPIFEQFKLHTNRFEANADGVTEYFGAARYPMDLTIHQRLTDDLAGASPANVAIAYASGISLTLVDNGFNNNNVDGFGGILPIPTGIDTSIPVAFTVGWIPSVNTAGNVELEMDVAQIQAGDVLDGSIAVINTPVVVPINAQQDELQLTEFSISIDELVPGELLAYKLFRDATGGNAHDTLVGNAEIVSWRAVGYFWRP